MDRKELVAALFEEFDTNQDGVISRGEFTDLIDCLLGKHGVKTRAQIFDEFDANHDNVISRDELIDLIIEYAI